MRIAAAMAPVVGEPEQTALVAVRVHGTVVQAVAPVSTGVLSRNDDVHASVSVPPAPVEPPNCAGTGFAGSHLGSGTNSG